MNKKTIIFLICLAILIISPFVFADSHLPIGLLKIQEQNKIDALNFLKNISFALAFLAGILSLLSPCVLPTLPAFFAYSFKEKKNITRMTLVFFFGFTLIFIIFGVFASILGSSLSVLQKNNQILVLLAGIFLIFFGLMSLFGKGFSGFRIFKKKPKNDFFGVFLFGIGFALGWTACLGPILAGVLLMAGIFGNLFYSGLLLFFYSLGLFIPLFILSFFFDKYNLANNKYIKGKIIKIFDLKFHTTNLISGILLITIGILFIIYRGTSFFNTLDPFRTKQYFYSFQNVIIGSSLLNIVGIILLIIFLIFLWRFLKSEKN